MFLLNGIGRWWKLFLCKCYDGKEFLIVNLKDGLGLFGLFIKISEIRM